MSSPIGNPPMNAEESADATLQNDSSETAASVKENSGDIEEKAGGWKSASPAPDGGTTAWLVVLGAWCVLLCSFGWINSIGTFQSYYETALLRQYSPSQISWIPSLQVFFMFSMGPIVGRIFDKYGPRYLLLVGSLLHVFGLMMASISTEYYQLLLSQGVCSAIGVASIFQGAISSIPGWFNKKLGAVYGIVSTGSSIGGVIFPIMISRLISEVGYGWSMRIGAFMILFLVVIANVTVKTRLPPNPQTLSKERLLAPFFEVKMVLVTLGFLLLTFGVYIPMDYIAIEAIYEGMSPDLAQYLVAILNAASLFGRISAGILSDRLGTYNIFVVVCYIAGVLILALWIPATANAPIIVFAVLFGFASGAYIALLPNLIVKISPFREIGYRTGVLLVFASIGGLTTNPIAGAILQHSGNGSYRGMKIFSGVCLLAGTTLVLSARLYHTGLKLRAKF